MNVADEIQKLQNLRDSGSLSDAEFEQAKKQLLARQSNYTGFIHKMGRSRTDSVLGGVCGGLAEQMSVPSWVLRVAVASAILFSFGGVGLIYILLWMFMPYSDAK